MKKLIAAIALTAVSLLVQSGCGWPRACCVTETSCCPDTPNLANPEPDMPLRVGGDGVQVAKRPLMDEATRAPDSPPYDGRRAYQFDDPAAPLPPSPPSSEESVIRR